MSDQKNKNTVNPNVGGVTPTTDTTNDYQTKDRNNAIDNVKKPTKR